MLPTTSERRIRSDRYLFQLQYYLGLHLSAGSAVFARHAELGNHYDPLGDRLLSEALPHGASHDAALRVWHDADQASTSGTVVMGDKTDKESYEQYNDTHCIDLGEVAASTAASSSRCRARSSRPAGAPSPRARSRATASRSAARRSR